MTQQRRLLLAIGLFFVFMLPYQYLVLRPQEEARLAALAAAQDAGAQALAPSMPTAAADGGIAVAPTLSADDGGLALAAPPPPVDVPVRTVDFDRETTKLRFTSEGGGLASAMLLGSRERQPQQLTIPEGYQKLFGSTAFGPPAQMNLAEPPPQGPPQFGVSINGATPLNPRLHYAITEEQPGRITFSGQDGPWQVTKTFTWDPAAKGLLADTKLKERSPAGYELALDVTLKNLSAQTVSGDLVVHTVKAVNPEHEQGASMFGGIGNQAATLCRVADNMMRKLPPGEPGMLSCGSPPLPDLNQSGLVHFVGIDQQYFLLAVWPRDAAEQGRCALFANATQRTAQLQLPLTLASQQSVTKHFGVFLGPKELELLGHVGEGTPGAPGLEKTVDFGWWAVICKMLLFFLRFFHALLGNWGIAIVLLTVMVKVVLLPLTHRAMVNAERMKDVQLRLKPQLDEINKKYEADPSVKQQKTMELYQKEGVNPFEQLTGCLPLLMQIPIWGALFTTLRTSYDLYGEPFWGWSDLTQKDPTYLLPLALGVTMLVTQRLQPQMTADKSQAFMFQWVMPIFFTLIMMNYPAGLALYIFTNNLLSIAQQYALKRYLKAKKAEAGTDVAKDTRKKLGASR